MLQMEARLQLPKIPKKFLKMRTSLKLEESPKRREQKVPKRK